MSGARLLREVAASLWTLATSLLAWVFIAPWAALVPRRRDWIAVIGRGDGQFLDNAKYFFLQCGPLLKPGVRIVFVTERIDVANKLADTDFEVMLYPSLRSAYFLLRTGVTVVDSSEWFERLRRFLLIRSKLVQLWHGVGFKRIGLDKWRNQAQATRFLSWPGIHALRLALHLITGRLVCYDVVNTTSIFYRDEVFKRAFLSHNFLVCGYPRNTFGTLDERAQQLTWRNVDSRLASDVNGWLKEKRRIVLVTPTFRDSRATPIGLTRDVVSMLDTFCDRHRVEFIFKFHSLEMGGSQIRGRHLHQCSADSDLYPLMPMSSALITDYSSIYMDYLLLDKPVLFLVPDREQYVHDDREMQFDFDEMTPGPKLVTWRDAIDALTDQWQHDTYADSRNRLKRLAFDNLDPGQAVPKLIEFMRSKNWITGKV